MDDKFYRKAKDLGFRARSVFKLEELIEKYHIVKKGDYVLDLGASPGSWMQYLSKFAYVFGVDISPIDPIPNTKSMILDVFDKDAVAKIKTVSDKFDVVVSDMAPKTCGKIEIDQYKSFELCERAFHIAQKVLKVNGNFLCKIFQSREADEFYRELKKHFVFAKTSKPEASRAHSKEIYIICKEFKGF
jgi:23S rRNA (uridine2552-2'-O)-methyltransferase